MRDRLAEHLNTPEWLPNRDQVYVIFGYAGQGQQTPDMFMDWYEHSRETDEVLSCFHKTTGTTFGEPLDEKALEQGPLMQPANVTLAVLGTRALNAAGIMPNETFGHSLGEYGAVYAAGCIEYEPLIKLAKKRGEATHLAIQKLKDMGIDTGMMAVSTSNGDARQITRDFLTREGIPAEEVDVTNINSRGQAVAAGDKSRFARIAKGLESVAKSVILGVDGAYHHFAYMKPAANSLKNDIDQAPLKSPDGVKLYSPTTVGGLRRRDGRLRTRDEIAGMLKLQLTSEVKWADLIEERLKYLNRTQILGLLARKGASQVLFIEVGAFPAGKPPNSGVLIGNTKRIVREFKDNRVPIEFYRISRPADVVPVNSQHAGP